MADLLNLKSTDFEFVLDNNGSKLFLGPQDVLTIGGTWTPTRIADGDFVLRKTAAADTSYITASLRDLYKTTPTSGVITLPKRGAKVKSIDVIYSIGTLALTSQTPTVWQVTYANNAANTIAAHGGTLSGTLATATQANPYVSTLTLGTPVIADTALQDIRIQIAIVAAATSAYDFYGMVVTLDQSSV